MSISTALVPSWLALPKEETPQRVSLVSLGIRELPSLALDGTPYDRPFHVASLPSVATRGERRKAAKVAKAEMEGTITAEEFNKLLGTGELILEEGEEWMATHDTKNRNLCKEDLPCFINNHTVDKSSGKKRRPERREMHDRSCLQRRCLEVQDALKKGRRVVKGAAAGKAAKKARK